jgi:hypothetical protein
MNSIKEKLDAQNWSNIREQLHANGYASVKKILRPEVCKELISDYDKANLYRKTISMERYRFGLGEYKYFSYPLPDLITQIRETVYSHIAPVANRWMEELCIEKTFPETHSDMIALCAKNEQTKPTVLILKYGKGGFNTLHQDLYGDVFFPMQVVLFLNEPGQDYTGGEFVLTEQIPRAQSKANVLTPGIGDMLVFTTNFRPVKGSKGFYRVNMKHGVSPVHSGERHTLGIIFHDALS